MKISSIKESFANILETPDRVTFRDFLKSNFGELNYIDFKEDWIENDKLARHILAMANSGGGLIAIGIQESNGKINPIGLSNVQDKSDIQNKLNKLLPNNLEFEILDFHYEETEYQKIKGKYFQVILISNQVKYLPFLSKNESKSLKKDIVYVRRGTQSVQANYEELQKLFNKRITSEYNSSSELKLEEHLSQLKVLYGQIKKYYFIDPVWDSIPEEEQKQIMIEQESLRRKNIHYPREEYEEFVSRLIEIKKMVIEGEIKK